MQKPMLMICGNLCELFTIRSYLSAHPAMTSAISEVRKSKIWQQDNGEISISTFKQIDRGTETVLEIPVAESASCHRLCKQSNIAATRLLIPNQHYRSAHFEDMVSKDEWTSMGGGRLHPNYCPKREDFVVTFDEPHDHLNPLEWNTRKKYRTSFDNVLKTLTSFIGFA